jgi:methylmalonyl-CoA mutase cobalamin-binding domain/chain
MGRSRNFVSDTRRQPRQDALNTTVLIVNAGSRSRCEDSRITALLKELNRNEVGSVFVADRRSPLQIVQMVVTYGFRVVVLVGFPSTSVSHLSAVPRVMRLLRPRAGSTNVFVVAEAWPGDDVVLESHGVAQVFTPGRDPSSVVEQIRASLDRRSGA